MKRLTIGLALLMFSTGIMATKAPPSTDALIKTGKEKYASTCSSCHGADGTGNGTLGKMLNPKPRDFAHAKFKNGDKVEDIFKTITDGLKGTAMGGYKHISENDRWAIAYYVKTFQPADKKKS